ncbi:MAG: hypothetical protein HYY99_00900, partial [Candidatus Colwellbacteria bacterium]|nr:hypothetical protein [Candidatus Colwellbacteria bacterium]
MKAKMRWLILLLVLLAGLSVSGVAKAEPCLLSAPPLTGQSTTDWYLFVEFTSPEYVLVSFGPWSFGSLDEAKKNLTPPTEDFKKRIRAIGKVKVVGIYLDQLIPEGAYLPTYTSQQFTQFDGSNGLSLPGMTSDLAAVTSGQPPLINKPTEGQLFEVELGKEWSFRIEATDPEGDPLYYDRVAFKYPRDMYIWGANGLIRWKPISSDLLGQHQVGIVVSDTPWPYTCQVRRTFYVNVVASPANPPTEPPPVTTPPTNTPPVITPPTITPVPDNNNQGNQGQQGNQGNQGTAPAGGGQTPPQEPPGGPAPVETPVQPVEPDGGEPDSGENPPSDNTNNPNPANTSPDAADLQEIQRQLDEIQRQVNELEAEVTRVLGDSSSTKPAQPLSLGL